MLYGGMFRNCQVASQTGKDNGIVKSEKKNEMLDWLPSSKKTSEFLEKIPRVSETLTSCQQDSVLSHGKHCQGN